MAEIACGDISAREQLGHPHRAPRIEVDAHVFGARARQRGAVGGPQHLEAPLDAQSVGDGDPGGDVHAIAAQRGTHEIYLGAQRRHSAP